MLNKIYSSRLGELVVSTDLLPSGTALSFPGSQLQVATNHHDYHFSFLQFTSNALKVRFYQFESKIREKYTWVSDPMITLRMGNLQSFIFHLPYLGKQVLHQRDYNLFHIPHYSVEFTLGPEETVWFLDIIITEDHLRSLEVHYPILLADFLNKTMRRQAARLKPQNSIASIEVLHWLDKLPQLASAESNLLFESEKHIDQLIHTCFSVMTEGPSRKPARLSLHDVNILYRVASFLEESERNITIPELAENFKISTYKLQKGFKEIFGYPVLHHRFEEKMRLALKLVQDKRYYNKQVAGMLGYSDPQSFSRAFKNRFGYTPYRNAQKM